MSFFFKHVKGVFWNTIFFHFIAVFLNFAPTWVSTIGKSTQKRAILGRFQAETLFLGIRQKWSFSEIGSILSILDIRQNFRSRKRGQILRYPKKDPKNGHFSWKAKNAEFWVSSKRSNFQKMPKMAKSRHFLPQKVRFWPLFWHKNLQKVALDFHAGYPPHKSPKITFFWHFFFMCFFDHFFWSFFRVLNFKNPKLAFSIFKIRFFKGGKR